MGKTDPDSGVVKRRLLSLYESSLPQLFSQLLVDYDQDRRRVDTEAATVYDLRAAARVQILFADGFKPAAAIRFLQEAIRHIETFGLPPSEGPVLYPDGGEVVRRAGQQPPAVEGGPAERRPEAAARQSPARAHESPSPPALPPAASMTALRAAGQPEETEAAKESRAGRIPALLSSLYGPRRFTSLNLSFDSRAEALVSRR